MPLSNGCVSQYPYKNKICAPLSLSAGWVQFIIQHNNNIDRSHHDSPCPHCKPPSSTDRRAKCLQRIRRRQGTWLPPKAPARAHARCPCSDKLRSRHIRPITLSSSRRTVLWRPIYQSDPFKWEHPTALTKPSVPPRRLDRNIHSHRPRLPRRHHRPARLNHAIH